MPKTIVVPEGTSKPLAPYSPGTLADGILYVSGTLPFDKNNDVVHVGDAAAQTRHVLETIKSVIETAGGIPVLVRGGSKAPEAEILARTAALIAQGAAGIVYGRNIIQHPKPAAITRALMAVVHDGATPADALKFLA